MSSMLHAAREYVKQGFSVIPTNPKTKRPFFEKLPTMLKDSREIAVWHPFQENIASEHILEGWFADGQANVSIVTGKISGNLIVFDFDHQSKEVFPKWMKQVGPLSSKLPIARTGKGKHVYVRFPFIMGNRKLAYSKSGKVRIETRGEGGYIQAPPSIHSSGVSYKWEQLCGSTIPILTVPAVQSLLECCFQFNEKALFERAPTKPAVKTAVLTTSYDQEVADKRLRHYAQQAAINEATVLATVAEGSRNDELNKAAFRLGKFVSCELIQTERVHSLLYEACLTNRYIDDDGVKAFERTFWSGLEAGRKVQNFKDILVSRLKPQK